VLDTTKGITNFFSCAYKPGAMKAHNWYSTTGRAIKKAVIIKILSGTMKGEITEVAIKVAPLGKLATKGCAKMSYKAAGPGYKAKIRAATPTPIMARTNRSRNSTK